MILVLFIFSLIFFQPCFCHQNCYRFCRVYLYPNDILDLHTEFCSHVILDAHGENMDLGIGLLEETFMKLKKSNILPSKVKIMAELKDDPYLTSSNQSIDESLMKILEKFDGYHFHWTDGTFTLRSRVFENQPMKIVNFNVQRLRKKFPNKIISVAVGIGNTLNGFFDFNVFQKIVDFVSLESKAYLSVLHSPNFLASILRKNAPWISSYPKEKLTLDYLAHLWISNGFTKEKLYIKMQESNR